MEGIQVETEREKEQEKCRTKDWVGIHGEMERETGPGWDKNEIEDSEQGTSNREQREEQGARGESKGSWEKQRT